jgi:hypothetical protein
MELNAMRCVHCSCMAPFDGSVHVCEYASTFFNSMSDEMVSETLLSLIQLNGDSVASALVFQPLRPWPCNASVNVQVQAVAESILPPGMLNGMGSN